MIVQVKLFALARQLAGQEEVELELAKGATVADVRFALVERIPELRAGAAQLMFAVDNQYAGDTVPVTAKQELACIPPVSGG